MGCMKWKDRRVTHAMKDPVRGEFRKTGEYFPHPGRTPMQVMLTGVVTAPGIPPTPAEHLRNDLSGREFQGDTLPALIDRADPTRFVILWDEIPKPDPRQQALQEAAQVAKRMSGTGAETVSMPQVNVHDGQPTPEWARDMIDDLRSRGMLNADSGPVTVQAPDEVLHLAAGNLSGADAARLGTAGQRTTATLTAIADVPVPQVALPGPTASLCDLTLQVSRADGSSYTAQARLGFRNAARRAAIAVIGGTLPVVIDPADPSRIAIDMSTLAAQHPDTE